LNDRRVRFTATASEHVDRERAWWLENRDHRELFAAELEAAVTLLSVLPGVGNPYPQSGVAGLRRLYLDKLGCHLYYTFDDDDVIVMALWGARRKRTPLL
jgi:plasmid stabilization system protein ParE